MAHIEFESSGKMVLRDDWYVEDVLSIRPDLTGEQAENVLEAVADRHDCNIGITWDVIKWIADDLYEEIEEKENAE